MHFYRRIPNWRLRLPRRWLQIRLRTVFLLATVVCIGFAWPHLRRQYAFWRLCSYGDRDFADLWTVKEGGFYTPIAKSIAADDIKRLARQLVPAQSALEKLFDLGAPCVFRTNKDGPARLLMVFVQQPFFNPGSGCVRVVLLDRTARIIADKTIETGIRFFPKNVSYEPTEYGFACLIVDSDYFWDGATQQQWIAVRDRKVAEVRKVRSQLENGHWMKQSHELGPEYRFASHSDWSRALLSSDKIDVLEALLDLPPREVIEARDPNDISRLHELSCSTDTWIRDGATAALAQFAERAE